MTDEFDQFDGISPEDFTGGARMAGLPTSTFEGFVESCKFALRNAVVLNQGLPVPMIVISSGQDVWPLPSPGGTLRTTLPWIREQVAEKRACWFFIAIKAQVAWYHSDQPFDTSNKENLAESGAGVPGVFFYAAQRNGSWFERRMGCARFAGQDLSPVRDAPSEQPSEIFDSVMK